MKIQSFWNVTLCHRAWNSCCFTGSHCINLQGQAVQDDESTTTFSNVRS